MRHLAVRTARYVGLFMTKSVGCGHPGSWRLTRTKSGCGFQCRRKYMSVSRLYEVTADYTLAGLIWRGGTRTRTSDGRELL